MQRSYAQFAVLAAIAVVSAAPPSRAQAPQRTPQWPVTMQDAQAARADQAAQSSPQPTVPSSTEPTANAPAPEPAAPDHGWTETEIATARARCNVIIAQYDAEAAPMEPIREGDCGSPHPVRVSRVGAVTFSQPAIVNCEVIAALGDWMKVDVQPAAKQFIGARVTSLEVLSSYSCRNAYGRKKTRLSEHGRANAIDIKSFHFDRQQVVDLTADWGMTERDIRARIAAAEAAAKAHAAAKARAEAEAAHAKALAEAQSKGKAGQQPGGRNAVADSASAGRVQGSEPAPDSMLSLRGMVRETFGKTGGERSGPSALTLEQPTRLGGPKAKSEPRPTPAPAATAPATIVDPQVPSPTVNGYTARQQFLRAIHAAACRRFGTVLGPEANEAHRNHFHLDMADRGGRGSFCE